MAKSFTRSALELPTWDCYTAASNSISTFYNRNADGTEMQKELIAHHTPRSWYDMVSYYSLHCHPPYSHKKYLVSSSESIPVEFEQTFSTSSSRAIAHNSCQCHSMPLVPSSMWPQSRESIV
mmetsp:Transcript_40199/g.72433  ORF Transcript_40199/g.72433 Transcript_40199/m.72433 type:complete len:122 (+) Transcript_40199:316-681(+)